MANLTNIAISKEPEPGEDVSCSRPERHAPRPDLIAHRFPTSRLLVLLFTLQACVPAVTHGPRVHEGWQGGGMLSYGYSSLAPVGDYPEILPPTALFLRRGWAADSTKGDWGRQIGVQVSPLLLLAVAGSEARAELLRAVEGDLYFQAPRGNPRGVGITASRFGVMPYVQYGRPRADGNSWYTTQGLAALGSGNYNVIFWAPAFALREVGFRGRHAVHVYLSGAFGFSRRDDYIGESREWSSMWMLSGGIGLELGPEPATPP